MFILILLLIAYLLWRSYKYNKVLTEKNRRLLAEIEQHEQEQQHVIEKLEATPEAELTSEQQRLYSPHRRTLWPIPSHLLPPF